MDMINDCDGCARSLWAAALSFEAVMRPDRC